MGDYDESAEAMGAQLEDFMQNSLVNIVGGCCGTTPDHIKEFTRIANKYKPRAVQKIKKALRLSGLEAVTISKDSNFVNIGERTNVMGSVQFKRLIKDDKLEEALEVALNQVEGGAQAIDVNMDDGMIEGKDCMIHF